MFFNENGYLHVKNCIPNSAIINFRESFFSHFNTFFNENIKPDFDSHLLGSLIDELRLRDSKKVIFFYHTVKLLSSYQELFLQDSAKASSELLLKTKSI